MRFGEQDEKLDRALRMIGQASAREGLEGRILRGVEARQSEATGRDRATWPRWAAGLALALVIAGVITSDGHRTQKARQVGVAHWGNSIQKVAPVVAVLEDTPSIRTNLLVRTKAVNRKGRPSVASKQIRETSFPAPEARLTEQERLLRAFAEKPQQQAVEALDPVRRAEQVAEIDKAAQAFFEGRNNGGYK